MIKVEHCPVCTSTDIAFEYTGRCTRSPNDPARWDVWRCSACGHGFLNAQPTIEELSPYYHSSYACFSGTHGTLGEFEAIVDEVRRSGTYRHVNLRPGMRVLDVGAGGGAFLRVLREVGVDVFGIEPSEFGVQQARDAGLEVYHGTVEQFYTEHGDKRRFDLITFNHVVEHLPDPVGTLGLAGSLLNDQGTLWVAVPNAGCESCRRLRWRWHSTDLPLHLMQFTLSSMRSAVERAQLDLIRMYTYSLPAGVRGSSIQRLRWKWGIPRRLGKHLISQRLVEARARRMDAANAGEAIIVELTRAT